MKKKSIQFTSRKVDYYFDAQLELVSRLYASDHVVFVTDEHIYKAHSKKFNGSQVIVLPAGEVHKHQGTADFLIGKLIEMGADRRSVLVGVGGGVVTDITGYVASVYMRGIRFGFVPTTILAMVDASIGGKNGIDVGAYKNLVGTINQPSFLLYDLSLLKSLPKEEWVNGFAEIIKHACIKDAVMLEELETNSLNTYRKDAALLASLIQRNALLKSKVVQKDEFEQADRKLLNFGHTLGHAIENNYSLPHGHAVSIGMIAACKISEEITGFPETKRISKLIKKYGLPAEFEFDAEQAITLMRMDKKKIRSTMSYVLLQKTGKGIVKDLPMEQLEEMIKHL